MSEHGPLGRDSVYPDRYDPGLLHPISRLPGRQAIGLGSMPLPFHGEDVWNAYEVSWLNARGKPQVALLTLRVPAASPCIVESKSLKLYLGSFNQCSLPDAAELQSRVARDLTAVVGLPVGVELTPLTGGAYATISELPGRCLDELDIAVDCYEVNPRLLQAGGPEVREQLHSHLLRSRCPVTGQPDWASVAIDYQGSQLDPAGLLRYLISFRNNQEFHEQCVERIFCDIQNQCGPRKLTVFARYTRRGGIDINPYRSTLALTADNPRLVRQ
ncbi:MAG: NADPH-dependent 7-cyano-7-deazaguanine reductase QueF [Pseudomonadota bacterium]|nr:NADPH-dependent 7-cyano-7-deazaguanine reductase QueF [Pseudomonadales bacterium]MDY6918728.1 NADPH-dependent 7-cyano-7-deazaguanine reductase QueF [Pseudomonadota bacterium]